MIALSQIFLQTDVDNVIHTNFPRMLDACTTMLTFTKYVEQRDAKRKRPEDPDDEGVAKLSDYDILYNLVHNNNINQPVNHQNDEDYVNVNEEEDDEYVDDDSDDDEDKYDFTGDEDVKIPPFFLIIIEYGFYQVRCFPHSVKETR